MSELPKLSVGKSLPVPSDEDILLASEKGYTEWLQELLSQGGNVEATGFFGARSLHRAAKHGWLSTVRALLDSGADVNARDENRQTPLHEAATAGLADIVQVLIAAGADVKVCDKKGSVPLSFAAMSGDTKTVRLLIAANANTDVCDFRGETPLHRAAGSGHVNVAKLLIDAGSDIEATDLLGRTPLHQAAVFNKVNTARVLLEAGANIQGRDKEGRTPLAVARLFRRDTVAQFLEGKGAHSFSVQEAQQSPFKQKGGASAALSWPARADSSPPVDKYETSGNGQSSENLWDDEALQDPVSQEECTDLPERATESLEQKELMVEQSKDSTSSSGDSTSSSESTGPIAAVKDLFKGEIFHEEYCLESTPVLGKFLVRFAKRLHSEEKVVLKFYSDRNLYVKSLEFYETFNQTTHVCKPLERIHAQNGFPDCLVYLRGAYTLEEWLRIPDIGSSSKRETLQLVAAALCDLHAYNVVHCDLKPANLAFFPMEYKWKLLDMDSALNAGEAGTILTTILYAAPEILLAAEEGLAELAVQTSTDMWSYGIIAYELLTGERFYQMDLMEATVQSVLEFLRSEKFEQRLNRVKDKKQRHFIKKFLKWDSSKRQSAQRACSSSFFETASITISKPLVSGD